MFSEAGDIVIKSMMGGYLVYFKGKLIGDVCGDELFLKRTLTSDRLLADSELRYPYEGSKTLMHVFDSFIERDIPSLLLWDAIFFHHHNHTCSSQITRQTMFIVSPF